jgi:hypothetical protein
MALQSDEQGFLIGGTPIYLREQSRQMRNIGNDVRQIKNFFIGNNSTSTRTQSSSRPSRSNQNDNRVSVSEPAPIRSANQRASVATIANVAREVVNANNSEVNRQAERIHRRNRNVSEPVAAARRDSQGRFIAGSGTSSSTGGAGTQETSNRSASFNGTGILGRAINATDGIEEADPTIKAFKEVAEPLKRGYDVIFGDKEDKQVGWLRKIFSSLNFFRRDENRSNRQIIGTLGDIENAPSTGSSGVSLFGTMLALGGIGLAIDIFKKDIARVPDKIISIWSDATLSIKSGVSTLTETISDYIKSKTGIDVKGVVSTITDTKDRIKKETGPVKHLTLSRIGYEFAKKKILGNADNVGNAANSLSEWGRGKVKKTKELWNDAKDYLYSASKKAGVNFDSVTKIANFESGFNPNAAPITKSGKRLSSAHGYGQFIDGTWTDMVNKYGNKYGIADAGNLTKEQAAKYRGNKSIQAGMLAEFTRENIEKGKKYGGNNDDANVYAFHNLGDGDAKNLLSGINKGLTVRESLMQGAKSSKDAARIEKVIANNKSLYGDGSISASDAYKRMGNVMNRGSVFASDFLQKQPTASIASPKIPAIRPPQAFKMPSIPDIYPSIIPMGSSSIGATQPSMNISMDIGQDVSDRGIAHIVTGGLSGR